MDVSESILTEEDIEEVEDLLMHDQIIRNSCVTYDNATFTAIPRPFENPEYDYTVIEDYKMKELFQVLPTLERKVDFLRVLGEVEDTYELIIMSNLFFERQIKRFVKSIKQMPAFQNISDNDKHVLVKYASSDIFMLRGILLFDTSDETWTVPIVSQLIFLNCIFSKKNPLLDLYRASFIR